MASCATAIEQMQRHVVGDPRVDTGADASCRSAEALVAAGAAPQQLSDAQVTNSHGHKALLLHAAHQSCQSELCLACDCCHACSTAVVHHIGVGPNHRASVGHRPPSSCLQMLAVMDRLMALEAAWHAGHFLPQSVYTCLYMLLPDRCPSACSASDILVLCGLLLPMAGVTGACRIASGQSQGCQTPNSWVQGGGDAAACRLLQGRARDLQHGTQPRAGQQRVHGARRAPARSFSAASCAVVWQSNESTVHVHIRLLILTRITI